MKKNLALELAALCLVIAIGCTEAAVILSDMTLADVFAFNATMAFFGAIIAAMFGGALE